MNLISDRLKRRPSYDGHALAAGERYASSGDAARWVARECSLLVGLATPDSIFSIDTSRFATCNSNWTERTVTAGLGFTFGSASFSLTRWFKEQISLASTKRLALPIRFSGL